MELDSNKMDFNYIMTHQKAIAENLAKKNNDIVEYDFKVVSFKIGNEYYGIDIMYVKEILKENKFTVVPNTLEFVVGVYNLRGDIIPIIDVAKMFHLSNLNEKKKGELKSIVVIRVDNLLIGLIVEQIQRVVPIRRSDIQPPSPLLGQINEKFIKGVAKIENKLCVIFDTDAIFSAKEKARQEVLPQQKSDLSEDFFVYFCNQIEQLTGCIINSYNKKSFRLFYNEFVNANNIKEMPSVTKEQAEQIAVKFHSKYTGELWKQPYVDNFKDAVFNELNKYCSDEVRVLNLGCSKGHETFTLLFLVLNYFPDADIDMIAADSNLGAISAASGFEISKSEIPAWINIDNFFINKSGDIYKINKEINDKIYFEFSDVKNKISHLQEFDLIVARDFTISLSEENYKSFIENLIAKLSSGGVLVIGDNEELEKYSDIVKLDNEQVSCYKKK